MQNSNLFYMEHALALAKRGQCAVSPNPMVGCVLVKNHRIIAEGFHARAGEAHAEIHALKNAGNTAKGATAYVTLEPCCHFGKTPPCTEALINAGIQEIYVATLDPNPLVSGKGVEALKKAGIKVHIGLCEQEAQSLNKIFFHFMKHRRPYVICKWAMSLDGKTITHPEDDRMISSEVALKHSHQLRQCVDAIVIGARTAMLDNPRLTVRYVDAIKHPIRFILSTQGDLPLDLRCFDPNLPGKTILVTTKNIRPKNIEVWQCKSKNQKIDLEDFLKKLTSAQICSLLVEGGEMLHASFFQEALVDEVNVYLAPKIISHLPHKKTLAHLNYLKLGEDLFFQASLGDNPCLPVS